MSISHSAVGPQFIAPELISLKRRQPALPLNCICETLHRAKPQSGERTEPIMMTHAPSNSRARRSLENAKRGAPVRLRAHGLAAAAPSPNRLSRLRTTSRSPSSSRFSGLLWASLLLFVGALSAGGCATDEAGPTKGLEKVRVALPAFQDFNSIFVGVENGFYAEEGIELEILQVDEATGHELLVADKVDLAGGSAIKTFLMNAKGVDATFAFPFFYFAGGALMYDPARFPDWKDHSENLKGTGGDTRGAIRRTLEQARGKRIGASKVGGEYIIFALMLEQAGMKYEDYQIVDLLQEELPPAILANSIDVMLGGLPQRLAVQKLGYKSLLEQTLFPSTIAVSGFLSRRNWVDRNLHLAMKMQKVIFRTLAYIENHPDETFPIISRHLRDAGSVMEVQDLKRVWNVMEIFLSTDQQFAEQVLHPEGRFYWKVRFEDIEDALVAEGGLRREDIRGITPEDLFYAKKIFDARQRLN